MEGGSSVPTAAVPACCWSRAPLVDELIRLSFVKRKTRNKQILQSDGALHLLLDEFALAAPSAAYEAGD